MSMLHSLSITNQNMSSIYSIVYSPTTLDYPQETVRNSDKIFLVSQSFYFLLPKLVTLNFNFHLLQSISSTPTSIAKTLSCLSFPPPSQSASVWMASIASPAKSSENFNSSVALDELFQPSHRHFFESSTDGSSPLSTYPFHRVVTLFAWLQPDSAHV